MRSEDRKSQQNEVEFFPIFRSSGSISRSCNEKVECNFLLWLMFHSCGARNCTCGLDKIRQPENEILKPNFQTQFQAQIHAKLTQKHDILILYKCNFNSNTSILLKVQIQDLIFSINSRIS